MPFLLDRNLRKTDDMAIVLAISMGYVPFLLGMQYSKHHWVIIRPNTFWEYVTILHSEISLYALLVALVIITMRSLWGAYILFTLYYTVCLLDNYVWFTLGRPFHPKDVMRGVELFLYYREFITFENFGWKTLIYTSAPLLAGIALLFYNSKNRFHEMRGIPRFRLTTLWGATAALAGYIILLPLVTSHTYLHYNSLIRIGKQIYHDQKFAQGKMSNAEKTRIFGSFQTAGAKVGGRRLNVIFYVLETAPYDYYPDISQYFQPWAERNNCSVKILSEHYTTYPESDRSLLSMMTGNYPCLNRGSDWIETYNYENALPKILAGNGYRTHLLSVAPLNFHKGDIMVKNLGFEHVLESAIAEGAYAQAKTTNKLLDRTTLYKADEEILEQALDVIRAKPEEPYFLTLLPQASHASFQVPPGYDGKTSQRELIEANARWQFRLISRIMKSLEDTEQAQNTIFLIVGDHGLRHPAESSLFKDQSILSPITFKVIFACCFPKDLPALQQEVTSHVDITPTILDMLGIQFVAEAYHGRSMLTAANRSVFFLGGEYLPVSGFTSSGWFFMENTNRNLVFKSREFNFEKAAETGTRVFKDARERAKISDDLNLVKGLLTD